MRGFMKKLGNWAFIGLVCVVAVSITIGLLVLVYYKILADLGYRWG